MTIVRGANTRRLAAAELGEWRSIPVAVVSDECEHRGVLANVRPLFPGRPFAGQALTIEVQEGENEAPRSGLARAWPGACIVIDARVAPDAAVFGGSLMQFARARGAVAVVVDGNVRDVADLRESGVAVASRGVTPRGPRWSGRFGGAIDCGGVRVEPGDLVVGDDDGVIAVPLTSVNDGLLARCRARLARETGEPAR